MDDVAHRSKGDLVTPDDELIALYDDQVSDLYAFVLRRCGRVELAEDLTQEVFVTAACRFRDTAEVPSRAWLYDVARSRLIDHWRREARKTRKLQLIMAGGSDGRQVDPAEEVTVGRSVMAALNELPADQRAALILRYLDDYTVSRVAETLHRSVRATESLLVRARRKLELEYGEQISG